MPEINYQNTNISFQQLARDLSDDNVTVFSLKDVTIEGNDLDMRFSRTLRGHPRLKEFSLVNVKCSDPEANINQTVEMVLVTCPKIETLRIDNTKISASAIVATGYCSTLKRLLLPNNDLHDEDAALIAPAVAVNMSVIHVDLRGNDMTDLGCAAFSAALEKNIALQKLELDGNGRISGGALSKVSYTLSERSAKAA